MKRINIVNDPLRKNKFLIKTKNIQNSVINLFGALSDSSIYFRKKSKLNGAPYIVGVNKIVKIALDKIDFLKLLRDYNYYLNLNTNPDSFKKRINGWVDKDRIPLEFIRLISINLSDNLDNQKKFLERIFSEIKYVTDRTGATRFKPPILLKDILDPTRIYDVGVSMGDGGLYGRSQWISDGSLNGENLNLTKNHMKRLYKLKKKIWGLSNKSIKLKKGVNENKNMYLLTVQNKFYVSYLNFVYDLPIGDKIKQNLKEPKILNMPEVENRDFLKRFLYRGLIDTDGSYNKGSSSINFWSKSRSLIEQAKKFFRSLDIKFNSREYEIVICSESYRQFLEKIGSSHERKLRTILKRISIHPKCYFFKGVNNNKIINGYFDLERLNFNVRGLGNLFKEFRNKLGWTRVKYSKEFNIPIGTIRYWEYDLNSIPFKEICRLIRLNNLDPYKELDKRVSYLTVRKIRLPLKPSKYLFDIAKFIIPQKSFNHACVIKRESTGLNDNKRCELLKKIKSYFNCDISINKYTGAFYIYSTYLTSFLDNFFIYERSWSAMNNIEANIYYNHMNNFLEEDMECKLPFEEIKREILVKKEASSDPKFGREPDKRSVGQMIDYGIVNINKPQGPS